MPAYSQIAEVIFQTQEDSGVPAFIPYQEDFFVYQRIRGIHNPSIREATTPPPENGLAMGIPRTAFATNGFNLETVSELHDLPDPGSGIGSRPRVHILVPDSWHAAGQVYSGISVWENLADTNGSFRLIGKGARADGTDFTVTFNGNFTYENMRDNNGEFGTFGQLVQTGPGTDNLADNDDGSFPLARAVWDIQLRKRNKYATVLPTIQSLQRVQFWCQAEEVISDFNSLVITPDATAQAEVQKSVTIRAEWQPIFEDQNNRYVFGTDQNGVPIVWDVASTQRDGREMVIQLQINQIT